MTELLRRYRALPADQHIAELDAVFGTDSAAATVTLDRLYASTRLDDADTRLGLLKADPATVQASDDALLQAAARLMPAVLREEGVEKERAGELLRLRPSYMRGWAGYSAANGKPLYPDANSTLRVSYGKVSSLDPRDGVHYTPLTTVAGILQKHTGVVPFDAPKPLRDAIDRKSTRLNSSH